MKLQQLRYISEVARQSLNLSVAAQVLFTSQPGISKEVRNLEEELGVDIFVRHGKRIVAITEPGRAILEIARRVLGDVENLKQVGQEFTGQQHGELTISTTHTQARYILPQVIHRFTRRYPQVRVSLRQGSPDQSWQVVKSGQADIGIAAETTKPYDNVVTLPCGGCERAVLVPVGHPLLKTKKLTLEAIAAFPIVTYDSAFSGVTKFHQVFAARGLTPNVVLTAVDSDVIKTYVELGMGVGIVARVAFDRKRDTGLRVLDGRKLFGSSTTLLGIRENSYLRGYTYDFIEMFDPDLTRAVVNEAMRVKGDRSRSRRGATALKERTE